MLGAYRKEPVTPTRGGVQEVSQRRDTGTWVVRRNRVQCREKVEKILQAKKMGCAGADCRSFL